MVASRFFLLTLVLFACSTAGKDSKNKPLEVPYPRQSCESIFFAKPDKPAHTISILGSWNDWTLPGVPMSPHPTQPGWWFLATSLPPGEYGYLLQEDGISLLDPQNPMTTFRGNDEVSLLQIKDCKQASILIEKSQEEVDGRIRITGIYTAAAQGGPLASVSASIQGQALRVEVMDPTTGRFEVSGEGLMRGRYFVEIAAQDRGGHEAKAQPGVWVQAQAKRWEDGLLYQVVVDRYRGDQGAVLGAPPTPGARAGGTLDGLRWEIERGTLDEMGVTALWLSPVYQNPGGEFVGRDGRMYEGYHGYWPLDSRGVEEEIGGEQALRAVIDSAHRRGIKVLLDVVPNHVFEKNLLFEQHRGQGWFNEQGACVCGLDGCDWGAHIQSCWFTPYLPDVRWQNEEIARIQVENVQWWVDRFGVDGVRIDAVPMMPRAATRRIAKALREAAPQEDPPFILGEVFTGPGAAGIDQIRYFLGPATLKSAFDFPLMWALRDAIAADHAGLDEIDAIFSATEVALAGSGSVPARMLGNHDVSRFLSAAAGDDGGDPWVNPPSKPLDPSVWMRYRAALTLVLTLPGMPVIYYGDELGMPGASDPDCRRVMPSYEGLPAEESTTLALTRKLGKLRLCSTALRRGNYEALLVSKDALGFRRDADGETVLVLLARGEGATEFMLPAGSYRDIFADGQPEVSGTLVVEPWKVRVLLSSSSSCE